MQIWLLLAIITLAVNALAMAPLVWYAARPDRRHSPELDAETRDILDGWTEDN